MSSHFLWQNLHCTSCSNPIRTSTPSPIPTSMSVPLVAPSIIPTSQHHNIPSLPIIESSPSSSYPTDNDTTHDSIPLVPQPVSKPAAPTRAHTMTTRSQNLIFKLSKFNDDRVKHPTPQALTASIALQEDEPTCFTQASKHAEWRTTMNEEFDALLKNVIWSFVLPSPAMNIVGSKWVFRIKRKADGQIERYKARLVA
jgi:hypothetical protein